MYCCLFRQCWLPGAAHHGICSASGSCRTGLRVGGTCSCSLSFCAAWSSQHQHGLPPDRTLHFHTHVRQGEEDGWHHCTSSKGGCIVSCQKFRQECLYPVLTRSHLYPAISWSCVPGRWSTGPSQCYQWLPGLQYCSPSIRTGRWRSSAVRRSLPKRDAPQERGAGGGLTVQRTQEPWRERSALTCSFRRSSAFISVLFYCFVLSVILCFFFFMCVVFLVCIYSFFFVYFLFFVFLYVCFFVFVVCGFQFFFFIWCMFWKKKKNSSCFLFLLFICLSFCWSFV